MILDKITKYILLLLLFIVLIFSSAQNAIAMRQVICTCGDSGDEEITVAFDVGDDDIYDEGNCPQLCSRLDPPTSSYTPVNCDCNRDGTDEDYGWLSFVKDTNLSCNEICNYLYDNTIDKESSIIHGASPQCRKSGDCQLNDLTNIVVNVINIIYGLVGSIILLFFIYGGFVWLTSGGNKERVTKGKQIIINSVIGMVIVFLSFTVVGLVFKWLNIAGWETFGTTGWFKAK